MTLLTPAEARQKACPVARVSGVPEDAKGNVRCECRGPDCVLWRWKPISVTDHRFLSAVARETALIEEERKASTDKPKKSASSEAAERVGFAVDRYVIRDENDKGWCGLGGRPE